jgi:methyl-accepting chemotaxis protein
MTKVFAGFVLMLSLMLVASAPAGAGTSPQDPQSDQAKAALTKVAHLLDQSGYKFTKVADSVWTIPFEGKSLASFTVIVSTQEDIAVIFVILAKKAELNVTPEMMRQLLQLNADLDRVKIGLDDGDDLFVRIDTGIRVLDVDEFKANVDQVSGATDEVHRRIKAYIKAGA